VKEDRSPIVLDGTSSSAADGRQRGQEAEGGAHIAMTSCHRLDQGLISCGGPINFRSDSSTDLL